ncbi:MAG: hypothetical protein ACI9QN_000126 [Arcticibacterium sp.]
MIVDSCGNYSDWLEIYNSTGQDIDLSGYYVSDDCEELIKYRLPISDFAVIPPEGYLLLWANGKEIGAIFLLS